MVPVLSQLVEMTDPMAVFGEVRTIIRSVMPAVDFDLIDGISNDVAALFRGDYPGYQACNTQYHDFQHTTDCYLAQARLIHGAVVKGMALSEELVAVGLVCALMHDTGYIQETADTRGTGARYTQIHVTRSIEFMHSYCRDRGIFSDRFQDMADILYCTGLEKKVTQIAFSAPGVAFMGKAMGTADLAGQMGDLTYIDKLVFLFQEFQEAGMAGLTDMYGFLGQSISFYHKIQKRLKGEMDNVQQYFRPHFRFFYHMDQDLYHEAMAWNHVRLLEILKQDRQTVMAQIDTGKLM